MKPVIIIVIALAVALSVVVAIGMSSFLMSPEQRVSEYNKKEDYVYYLENQIFNFDVEPYLKEMSTYNQRLKCTNQDTIFDKVACIDDPKLNKKFMDLVEEHDKVLIELRAMELGG